ncbi:unnamed protein product [Adineta ricciae]|uniref:Alpha/beta hydrolase fold-3 domain-containing protein n=1 Tax=Adineta ricciae TaxID=249248 RepID=A0A813MRJ6_ADIRI|nr:unnamed protein product [Adineta ricciae]CAF1053856.1 unnamed protein product [Adineta ricciae]
MAYLYRAPNNKGIEQIDRIRILCIPMKIAHLIGQIVEFFGVSDRVMVLRKVIDFAALLQNKKVVDANLQVKDTLIENVHVRIVRPLNDNSSLPVLIYFHGGGFYMGSVDTYNTLTSTLSRSANIVVVSVNYRLAPEHPLPAGLNDCYTVAKYLLEYKQSKDLHIDPTRVIIAGDSAGGSLAAIITMRLVTHPVSKYLPRLQVLIYPSLQFFDMMLPSYRQQHFTFLHYTSSHKLSVYLNDSIDETLYFNQHTSLEQKRWYRKYVDWSLIPIEYRTIYTNPIMDGQEGDFKLIEKMKRALEPDVSPLLVDNEQLAKLPSTYIITVGHDRLRDEGFIYARRVKRTGVDVTHKHYENTFHGSITFLYGSLGLNIAREMVDDIVQHMKRIL